MIHHAPSTNGSCQASGLKNQWLLGHAGMVQPKHEERQDVGVDGAVLQDRRVREGHARLFQQNARIALVGKMAAACEVNHDGAGEREQ
jgi:hypothetical protein